MGFEQVISPDATLDDLDLELAARVFGANGRPVEQVLGRFGLLVARGRGWAVTNAALLLFARGPLVRWHPKAGLRFFRVHGNERRVGAERNVVQLARLEQPLATLIEEAFKYAKAQIRSSEKLRGLFFRETQEYPEFAWQEAIMNAVAHRDYADRGRELEVWFYEDRMEIVSPGDLMPPVTVDDLREARAIHASRNSLLVRVFALTGLMREEGEGVPRMHEEMRASLLRHPEFVAGHSTVTVTLRNEPFIEGPNAEWLAFLGRLGLGNDLLRVLALHPRGFRNEDLRIVAKVDRDQAYRSLSEVVGQGVLAPPAASGRGAVYRLAPLLVAQYEWLKVRLPKLRAQVKEHGQVTSRDYCRLFDVDRRAALRELRRLVGEGMLEHRGARRGAHYVAGRALVRDDLGD